MMAAPPVPGLPAAAAAAAALVHLRGVEKHLENEGLVFSKETVQYLENAIIAIKELEGERKHTLELLEEETIKNCNLRVKIKGYPEIVMKEFEELVAAANRSRLYKLKEMEASIHELVAAVKSTYSKQELSEECNVTLCEEQEELRLKHEGVVNAMNQHMAARHTVNIEINDLHNLRKEEEEETVQQESAIFEVKAVMAKEADDFRERKDWLEAQIADLQRRLEIQKRLAIDKGEEYAELTAVLEALEKEVADYNQSIATGRNELAELFKKIRELLKEYEEKNTEKEELLKKKAELQTKQAAQDSSFDEEKEELLQQLKEAEDQLEVIMKLNTKLRNENNLLNTQYQALTDEEEQFCAERDRLVQEFERLSNMLTDRLDQVAKHLVETKDIEEEMERLQGVFDNTQGCYSREIGNLERTLQKEGEKRSGLQEQLIDITARFQKMLDDHNELLISSKEKSISQKKLLAELTTENERLKKEIQKSMESIKQLTEKLRRREAFYKKRDAVLEAEIKDLQEEYNTIAQLLQEKEELLKVNLPLAEQMQIELEGKTTSYTIQKDLFTALKEEERTLTKSIQRSIREIARLRRIKLSAKTEIQANREVILEQLTRYTHSLKFLERENYEMDRVLYILNAENDRLRAGIAHLREDIATVDSEAELYQSKRRQTQKDMKTLYDLFDMRWFKDNFLHKMFLKYEHEVMNALVEHLTRNKKRIETLDCVHDGLQLNCKEMEIVFQSKSISRRNEESSSAVA